MNNSLTGYEWKHHTTITTKDGSGVRLPSSYNEILLLPIIAGSPVDSSVYPKLFWDTLSSSSETWAYLGGRPGLYIICKIKSNNVRVHAAYSSDAETTFELRIYYR